MSGQLVREGYSGTGPGAITPDGCAVELYTRLAVGDEPDVIEAAVPAGAHILELGCGVGRVTRPLIERGFRITAVDESPQMLERVRGARTVCAPIESLDLGEETFDVVMLASFLVHAGDRKVREGLLRTCRRYVRDGGAVLIQREGPDYHVAPRERADAAGYTVRIVSSEPVGDGVRSVRAEYEFADARWTQTFRSRPLSKEEFEGHLEAAGLKVDRYLTDDGIWVRAVPV
ncbi:methyltransferase family protein [Streptomyces sp. KhCrAH-43]|uniref:class I SAM-dependent methyltransferase n=1 Tax=unclassified Streptomyces TaxID=2593676 RepID=UPI00037BE710|nr:MULTISPECIES: class I SAM-dependent methyltransferase [unclassified Streptomyces]MYS35389.1 methyltransferase domain-containing protein [Streptomyces sp. SID4920]MYX64834.1 methyltransferase domain-containing protein [Streptomyces sp. SID8373]RAJ65199.1 methyltransferase family protein [Streptomyces sp. KhCrAH-43]